MTRLSFIAFDKHERPRRASIITPLGTIKVEWRDVCGNRSWFTTGNLNAKQLAVSVIQRIERQFPDAHNPNQTS